MKYPRTDKNDTEVPGRGTHTFISIVAVETCKTHEDAPPCMFRWMNARQSRTARNLPLPSFLAETRAELIAGRSTARKYHSRALCITREHRTRTRFTGRLRTSNGFEAACGIIALCSPLPCDKAQRLISDDCDANGVLVLVGKKSECQPLLIRFCGMKREALNTLFANGGND